MRLQTFSAIIDNIGSVKTTPNGSKFCFLIVRKTSKKGKEDIFNIYVPEDKIEKVLSFHKGKKVKLSLFLNGFENFDLNKFNYTMKLRLNDIEVNHG